MGYEEYALELLNSFIAELPYFVVIVSMILTSLSRIKKTVNENKEANEANNVSTNESIQLGIEKIADAFIEKISPLVSRVENVEQVMSESTHRISNVETQLNTVVQTNKLSIDLVSTVVAKDPNAIKNGIAALVAEQVEITQEELTRIPDLLKPNWKAFKNDLREAVLLIGEERILQLVKEIRYERQENEE